MEIIIIDALLLHSEFLSLVRAPAFQYRTPWSSTTMTLRRSVREIVQRTGRANRSLLSSVPRMRRQSTSTVSSGYGSRVFTAVVSALIAGGIGGFVAADYITNRNESLAKANYFEQKYGGPHEVAAALKELRELLPPTEDGKERVSSDREVLEVYAYSHNSYHPQHLHSMVVRVFSTEDVVRVVNVARKYRIPITPYSGGTSLEGHYSGVSTQTSQNGNSSDCRST
jgi:D-lactate dehydrogenase (cytochrome)